MKRPIILLAVLSFSITTVRAAFSIPFDVAYFTTNYAASPSPAPSSDLASGLWLGNLRGRDTWRDLVVANKGSNTVSVRLCRDDGTFGALTNYPVGAGPTAVKTRDLNHDGYEDIVVVNSATNTVTVLLNNDAGTAFTNIADYTIGATSAPEPSALALADADGDGNIDIITANAAENSVTVATNDGSGAFSAWTDFSVGSGPRSIFFTDFDGDGFGDILTANKTAGTLTILYKRFGIFASPQTIMLFPGGDPQPVAALSDDLNGDGFRDIVTANYGSNTVSVLLNDGSGNFSVFTNYAVGTAPTSLVVRDLNNDGDADIAVANEGSGTVDVLLSNGDGSFVPNYTFTVGSSPVAIAGSNFDPGNMTDLAVANNGDNTVSILLYSMPLVQSTAYNLLEDANKVITLTASTYGGRAATFTIVSQPTNGVVTGSSPTFTYTPNSDYYGDDTFTYKANDGFNDSEEIEVTLHVLPVNDRPTFTVATTEVIAPKFGTLFTYTNFIASVAAGPANEFAQTVSYRTTTTNPLFFASQAVVTKFGHLTFRPSATAVGTNTVNIYAVDNGGSSSGGTNVSLPTAITIVVPANPFASAKGLYNGLFYETNEISYNSAGMVRLSVNANGFFSGKVSLNKTYGFKGNFDTSLHAEVSVPRGTNMTPLALTMDFVNTNSSPQIFGTVSDGTFTAPLTCDFAPYHALTNPAPQLGRYTMIIPGDDSNGGPAGNSYAFVSVTGSGVARMSGILSDKRGFSQTASISADGHWPVYIPLNRGTGAITSWLTFTNEPTSSLKGNLTWIKGPAPFDIFYPGGFTNTTLVSGSTYTNPVARILSITNGTTVMDGGLLISSLTNTVTLTATNSFVVTGGTASGLLLKVNLLNGYVYGSFLHPATLRPSAIRAVVLQQQNRAEGMFLGTTQTGSFIFGP